MSTGTDRDSVADSLAAAVRMAYLPALLAALAQTTGDQSLLRPELRPDPARLVEPNGGLDAEQRAASREVAIDVLRVLAERPDTDGARTAAGELRPLLEFMVGEPIADDLALLLAEELGAPGEDPRAPAWHKAAIDAEREFRVAVIGGGMSGLAAAHRLEQAGVEWVLFEKNADIGGTWFENRYPGCRVDVPNHLYSYSFFQRDDWPQRFTTQDGLLAYFREAADTFRLRTNIRCETEVLEARFDEGDATWALTTRHRDGSTGTHVVHAIVSAVGQLNRPRIPRFDGADTFRGSAFHPAAWPDDTTLDGQRVAVVGTGASGIQLIPVVAERAAEVHVYQRTPNWFMPTPDYHAPTPDGVHWLLANVPHYSQWYRLSLFWRLAEGILPAARVDPDWDGDGRSVSARNEQLRSLLAAYLDHEFADVPDLLAKVQPAYPPLAKRILLDNGIWAATLKRDNVELVTDDIERITPTGVVAGGRLREADAIVYATGFRASGFLEPIRITGRDSVDLHEQWGDDPRAYLGMTIPGFPNLFCLYGPNTNLVANGSIIFFSECEVGYLLGCIRLLLERRASALDCRREVHDAYNDAVDDGNRRMVWGAAKVNSWYQNAHGRITQNWPFSLVDFWRRTRQPDPADYDFL